MGVWFKTKGTFNLIIVTLGCILAISFLLLLVDKGTITGKFISVTQNSVVNGSITDASLWPLGFFIFIIIVFVTLVSLNKKKFLKK